MVCIRDRQAVRLPSTGSPPSNDGPMCTQTLVSSDFNNLLHNRQQQLDAEEKRGEEKDLSVFFYLSIDRCQHPKEMNSNN